MLNDLLRQEIVDACYDLYEKGYYRESMVNSILCLFDMIREESGLQNDGSALIGQAFSIEKPRLILADLQSESGRNVQKGIIQILNGYYQAYRNVASHSLSVGFKKEDAFSVLITVSYFFDKIVNAEKAIFLRYDGLYFCNTDGFHHYIRFYEDGVVITVPTSNDGEHKDILNWFNRENAEDFKHFSIGRYEINERNVVFDAKSSAGKVEYHCVIRPDVLHVKTHSHINGHESQNEYEFLRWKAIKA